MTRTAHALAAAFTLACAGELSAALPRPPAAAEKLRPFAFMIGTWRGQGELPGLGKYTDQFVYTWEMGRAFIRARYTLSAGGLFTHTDETLIAWDDVQGRVVCFTVGMDGSIGRSTLTATPKPGVFVFEGSKTGPNPVKELRSTLAKVDDDTVTFTIEARKDGEYQTIARMTFRRDPAGK